MRSLNSTGLFFNWSTIKTFTIMLDLAWCRSVLCNRKACLIAKRVEKVLVFRQSSWVCCVSSEWWRLWHPKKNMHQHIHEEIQWPVKFFSFNKHHWMLFEQFFIIMQEIHEFHFHQIFSTGIKGKCNFWSVRLNKILWKFGKLRKLTKSFLFFFNSTVCKIPVTSSRYDDAFAQCQERILIYK